MRTPAQHSRRVFRCAPGPGFQSCVWKQQKNHSQVTGAQPGGIHLIKSQVPSQNLGQHRAISSACCLQAPMKPDSSIPIRMQRCAQEATQQEAWHNRRYGTQGASRGAGVWHAEDTSRDIIRIAVCVGDNTIHHAGRRIDEDGAKLLAQYLQAWHAFHTVWSRPACKGAARQGSAKRTWPTPSATLCHPDPTRQEAPQQEALPWACSWALNACRSTPYSAIVAPGTT